MRERIPEVLDNDPELTKQIIAKMYHIELPKQTLDDYIEQEIAKSPEYRRRLAPAPFGANGAGRPQRNGHRARRAGDVF